MFTDERGQRVFPLMYNGTTYLPIRAVSNLLGHVVFWSGETRSINVLPRNAISLDEYNELPRTFRETTRQVADPALGTAQQRGQVTVDPLIHIVVNQVRRVFHDVNGNVVDPITHRGTTYVPIRGLVNALGADVSWDDSTRTIYITQESPPPMPTNPRPPGEPPPPPNPDDIGPPPELPPYIIIDEWIEATPWSPWQVISPRSRSTTGLPVEANFGYRIHDMTINDTAAMEFRYERPIREMSFRIFIGNTSAPAGSATGGFEVVLFNSYNGREIGRRAFDGRASIGTAHSVSFTFNQDVEDVLVRVNSQGDWTLLNIWLLDVHPS
jgi:hypothetical protein